MRRLFTLSLSAALLATLSVPATGQGSGIGSPSYRFLEAVRDRDGTQVTTMLNAPGTTIVNTRDVSTGRTALHIVVERRDITWINFLLQRGADPRIIDRAGATPLRLAAELGFLDGARALLAQGATANQANNRGETALHVAVQRRDVAMVRMLVMAGANPELTDNVAGKSPRDYAREDVRGAAVLAGLDTPRERPPVVAGPAPAGPN